MTKLAESSAKALKKRPEIMDKYHGLEYASPVYRFIRHFAISTPEISGKGMVNLKIDIGKAYKTIENKMAGPMSLDLKNGAVINLDTLCKRVSVFMPLEFSAEKSEEIMNFLLNNGYVKSARPYMERDNMNLFGYRWSIKFSGSGYPVLEEMFRDDIELLSDKGFKKQPR